jgi:hypothetical protein
MADRAETAPRAADAGASRPAHGTGDAESGFDRRVLRWVIGVGVVSLLAAVVLSVLGESAASAPASFANSFSHGALGHRALAELLRARGLGVLSRRSPGIGRPGPERPLILAEPMGAAEPIGQARLAALFAEAREAAAPVVLVLPKRQGEGERGQPEHPDWVTRAELIRRDRVERLVALVAGETGLKVDRPRGGAGGCLAAWTGTRTLRVELAEPQLFGDLAAPWERLVSCPAGTLIARRPASGEGPELWVVADPDLLNNQGLGRGDHAELVDGLFARQLHASGAVFDETIHGFHVAPGLLAEAARFPMVLAVLHGALLLAFALWVGMGRFGKPLPPPPATEGGREVLIESTAQLLNAGGDVGDSFERYLRQTVRAVAAAQGLPPSLGERDLRDRLQRSSEGAEVAFALGRCEAEMEELRGTGARVRQRAVFLARRLYRWRMEMTHGQ